MVAAARGELLPDLGAHSHFLKHFYGYCHDNTRSRPGYIRRLQQHHPPYVLIKTQEARQVLHRRGVFVGRLGPLTPRRGVTSTSPPLSPSRRRLLALLLCLLVGFYRTCKNLYWHLDTFPLEARDGTNKDLARVGSTRVE